MAGLARSWTFGAVVRGIGVTELALLCICFFLFTLLLFMFTITSTLLSISRTPFVCCMSGILQIAHCIFSCSLCFLDNSLALRASIHLVKSGTGRSLSSLSRVAESREPITNLSRIKLSQRPSNSQDSACWRSLTTYWSIVSCSV